jgi:MHS family proline/betaine transporter-like MFS transporter
MQWGWRFAYSISVIFGVLAYLFRRNMHETPVFIEIINNNLCEKKPVINSIKFNYKEYIIAIGLVFLPATSFYYIFMFLPNFLKDILSLNADKILTDNSFSLFIRLLIIPILGLIADKVGGIKIARLSCILFLVTSYPLIFFIVNDVTKSGVFLFIFSLLTTLNASTTPGLLINLLKPDTRCTMLSLSFNICFGVFGGLVPIISMLLTTQFENKTISIFYLMFAAIVTYIATLFFGKESTNVYK